MKINKKDLMKTKGNGLKNPVFPLDTLSTKAKLKNTENLRRKATNVSTISLRETFVNSKSKKATGFMKKKISTEISQCFRHTTLKPYQGFQR